MKEKDPQEEHIIAGPEVKDFVLGVNDGLVSIVALLSGVAGAVANVHFVQIAGVAGTLAGAISMASGAYISTKSQKEVFEAEMRTEKRHLEEYPKHERQEVRDFYRKKGFKGKQLEETVKKITSDKKVWLDTMMKEEFGIASPTFPNPAKSFATMGIAFFIGALFPLSPYFFLPLATALPTSIILTGLFLFIVGAVKGKVITINPFFSGLEMLAIGTIAALVTYYAGTLIGVNGA